MIHSIPEAAAKHQEIIIHGTKKLSYYQNKRYYQMIQIYHNTKQEA
ncbi:8309_t:CDS:1, partial [Racocetra persica]